MKWDRLGVASIIIMQIVFVEWSDGTTRCLIGEIDSAERKASTLLHTAGCARKILQVINTNYNGGVVPWNLHGDDPTQSSMHRIFCQIFDQCRESSTAKA